MVVVDNIRSLKIELLFTVLFLNLATSKIRFTNYLVIIIVFPTFLCKILANSSAQKYNYKDKELWYKLLSVNVFPRF